ncbi:MAG: ornithine carbamoyltransferase, partial [Pseudomonadota bacterium]|nr:ornithine carbamoyltransferase [Pseudomonadota bacterium]
MRHFLDIKDFDKDRLTAMLETARDMKSGAYTGTPLSGRHIGMIFEKPSTRTR